MQSGKTNFTAADAHCVCVCVCVLGGGCNCHQQGPVLHLLIQREVCDFGQRLPDFTNALSLV